MPVLLLHRLSKLPVQLKSIYFLVCFPYFFSRELKLAFHYEQEPSHPQVTSFSPLTAASIITEAHPTPFSTFIAFVGQFSWQAPHSIHAFGFTSCATFPSGLKTLCGHTVLHMPHLMHNSGSYSRVFETYDLNISNFSEYSH